MRTSQFNVNVGSHAFVKLAPSERYIRTITIPDPEKKIYRSCVVSNGKIISILEYNKEHKAWYDKIFNVDSELDTHAHNSLHIYIQGAISTKILFSTCSELHQVENEFEKNISLDTTKYIPIYTAESSVEKIEYVHGELYHHTGGAVLRYTL